MSRELPMSGNADANAPNLDPPDLDERLRVLDTAQSFIVQAPAGSGKTGLLIQRYLSLLACVNEPEEIVAITFTRKAAAEMRERLMRALIQAAGAPHPGKIAETRHEGTTRELASAALHRDILAGWHILDNPARLRIQTFDSLCASLTRQMPILSGFGSQPETVEDASDLYREAARSTIRLVEGGDDVARDVERLLEHLDNDVERLETLLIGMLAQRDHWLRHIHSKDRDELEAALRNTRYEALKRLCGLYPAAARDELIALIRYAASNLSAIGSDSAIVAYEQCGDPTGFPGNDEQDVRCWEAIATLLLTKDGGWRKQFTEREGFPPEPKARKIMATSWKERARALGSLLAENDSGSLCEALKDILQLPPSTYTDAQWDILQSITRLLPRAVAQLKLVFQSLNQVDFTEVAQGALRALGDLHMPTDLALALDYRIRHLLIDEFQDTSISQYELLEKLTSGWEPDDGRSMLAVGDPMQSIYRFREAEVGLFLRARAAGIGNVTLQPVTLSANFRSQRGIVDWVNATFSQVMPRRENITIGAVSYTESVATNRLLSGSAVSLHPFINDDRAAEASRVVEIAAQARDHSATTTAILVRNRSHLVDIILLLKEAGLRFRAIEIEGLGRRPVVQDLLALTRALAHPADRAAWLALLRAPWCGLLLADIHALVSWNAALTVECNDVPQEGDESAPERNLEAGNGTVWEWLSDDARVASISADGYQRLLRTREVLQACMENRCRQSLRSTVEAAWLALGGPAAIEDPTDFEDAAIYLDYLEKQEEAGSILSLAALEEGLERLFALPDVKADDRLQIMTIHKAKGLEFDWVIVPGLGRSPRSNDKKLFMWMETVRSISAVGNANRSNDLLLAPIQETGAAEDRTYLWLEKLEREKERLEDERLLYVAATRARQRLHLLGSTNATSGKDGGLELKPPPTRALLSRIWALVESDYAQAAAQAMSSSSLFRSSGGSVAGNAVDQSLRRFVSGWVLPPPPPPVLWLARPQAAPAQGSIEYSWAGEAARLIGNVVHRWLQRIATEGIEKWDVARIRVLRDTFKGQLVACGMVNHGSDMDTAIERVMMALTHAVTDPRGRWLLGAQQGAHSELRMTAISGEEYFDHVIDRTFHDINGQRWVVDYKTSSHEGADVEDFLNREQERYRFQLDRYANLMRLLDGQPVRRGLYFPLLKGWREWGDDV
ncbi:UvrD-helicase domain-containing protein [Nitrosospira sp. Is2]|uniref:UvrD-helicase domain-containing protein n=1 Tax=Nitrosospira sp. Is2 TaxID=3080532 RepID=UPI0029547D31|nr:UvrD-helicase domain-containing protein [Nitrosospira sp. Is2]WON73024.1 UvrD-helicase domain-containing protein [Nitrosospira sp. Is2]